MNADVDVIFTIAATVADLVPGGQVVAEAIVFVRTVAGMFHVGFVCHYGLEAAHKGSAVCCPALWSSEEITGRACECQHCDLYPGKKAQ